MYSTCKLGVHDTINCLRVRLRYQPMSFAYLHEKPLLSLTGNVVGLSKESYWLLNKDEVSYCWDLDQFRILYLSYSLTVWEWMA